MSKEKKYRIGTYLILIPAILFLFPKVYAQHESKTINDSWKFYQGECKAAASATYDDSAWNSIHLPHTWNTDAYTEKKYYQGTGWYRRTLTLPKNWQTKQVFLKLDAASKAAAIYMNGRKIGEHNGGYTACTFDITPFCSFGAPNSLAIHVDNARQDIPPISADFTFFGGIYRDVWLTAVPKQHFHLTNYGSEGIFISTPQVSEEKGTILIRGEIKNDAEQKASLELEHIIYNPDGSIAQTQKQSIQIKGGELYSFRTETAPILSPRLWAPEAPHLYRVESILRDKKTKAILDHSNHHTGFRWFSFDGKTGFSLNGKPYKLRGICRHQDQKPIGVALTDEMHRRDMKLMKEMGANAIRTSHNPPAPELVALCDRMGLMMQLEFVDSWHKGKRKNDYNILFDDWNEADMRSLVRHYRNHPSVIMWSIGNEVHDQVTDLGIEIARNLTAYSHDEDPTRPTSLGCNKRDAIYRDIVNQVDIFGLNYYHKTYPLFKEQNPTRRYHASETSSATSSRGEYFFPVTKNVNDSRSGFQLSSYDMTTIGWGCMPEEQFKMNEAYPFMSGEFVWMGFDYLGEPTPYNKDLTNLLNFSDPVELEAAKKELEELGKIKTPSRSSYFGIVDLCGFPKDRYYNYQSYWRKELPLVHILPHWNWPERVGEVTPVHIYTSGDEVELFLNGKSQGRRKKEHSYDRLTWDDVRYEPGELKAIAYKEGKQWAEQRQQPSLLRYLSIRRRRLFEILVRTCFLCVLML